MFLWNQISCFNTETNDFNQRTACRATVRWSKYTTVNPISNHEINYKCSNQAYLFVCGSTSVVADRLADAKIMICPSGV